MKRQISIQVIKAPSILGLRPTGVERLADTLLDFGLDTLVTKRSPLMVVKDMNHLYSSARDEAGMINTQALHDFSLRLKETTGLVLDQGFFPLVLGGDCSILLGVMAALKERGRYGLISMDAHADFYLPKQSVTGEAADMDIALVTGRGPQMLSNIDGLGPYVEDADVILVGQRDQEETLRYGSAQISQTEIVRYDLDVIEDKGVKAATDLIVSDLERIQVEGFWLHFDTDVIHEDENPAVDYCLPGGLWFSECEHIMKALIMSGRIKGLSVSIYNPSLDIVGCVGRDIAKMILRALGSENCLPGADQRTKGTML